MWPVNSLPTQLPPILDIKKVCNITSLYSKIGSATEFSDENKEIRSTATDLIIFA